MTVEEYERYEKERKIIEENIVSNKLWLMFREFPEEKNSPIRIIGSYDGFGRYIGHFPYIECHTVVGYHISGVGSKAARFFEDA